MKLYEIMRKHWKWIIVEVKSFERPLSTFYIVGVFLLLFTILMYWIFTENKRLLQEAKLALKKSKRKDYYKILGVDKNASTDEVKKAYRKRALVHHPG